MGLKRSSQANPSQANPSQANPSQANPSQANPSQANPSQANPSQANPSQANPSQANPSQEISSKEGAPKTNRRQVKGRRLTDSQTENNDQKTHPSSLAPLQKVTLTHRKQTHGIRNIWHILGAGLALWIYATFPYDVVLGLASLVTILFLTLDILRLKFSRLNHLTLKILGFVMHEKERDQLSGLSYMSLGFLLIALIFSRDVVLLTLLFVMFGDPCAAYVGTKYGTRGIGDKTVQGFMACFIVCSFISAIFFRSEDFTLLQLAYVSLFGGLIGGISEMIQIRNINDNFSMPVIAGSWLTLFLSFIL